MFLNDFFTAGNGIIIKQKLESKDFGKNGLMFYNCLFMIIPAILIFLITEDISRVIGKLQKTRRGNYNDISRV